MQKNKIIKIMFKKQLMSHAFKKLKKLYMGLKKGISRKIYTQRIFCSKLRKNESRKV